MAFRAKDLSSLTYANGFTLWHYRSTDIATDIDTTGYFNPAAAMVRVGDFLLVNTNTGGTSSHGIMVVVANANGVVDVANLTNVAATNTD